MAETPLLLDAPLLQEEQQQPPEGSSSPAQEPTSSQYYEATSPSPQQPSSTSEQNNNCFHGLSAVTEYKLMLVFLFFLGMIPVNRVFDKRNKTSYIHTTLYSLYTIWCLFWTSFPFFGFIYFFVIKLSFPTEDARKFGPPGFSEMSMLPLIQIPVGMLLTLISPCMLLFIHSCFRSPTFEAQFFDSLDAALVKGLKPIFRRHILLFLVVSPVFLASSLSCVHVTKGFLYLILPYYPQWWITLDIILHFVAFMYAMGHIVMSCVIFCLIQEIIRYRISRYSLQLTRHDESINEAYLKVVFYILRIEERVEHSSRMFQRMFTIITSLSFLALLVSMVSLFQNPIDEVWLGFFFGGIFIAPSFYMTFVASKITDDMKNIAPAIASRALYNNDIHNFTVAAVDGKPVREFKNDHFEYSDTMLYCVARSNEQMLRMSWIQLYQYRVLSNRCGFRLFGVLLTKKLVLSLTTTFLSFVAFALQRTIYKNAEL